MPLVIYYLLKFSISLAVVYLFYHFILRRLTFYNWNRWYLLGYTLLSFFIAAINITPLLQRSRLEDTGTVRLIPNFQIPVTHINNENQVAGGAGLGQWTGIILIFGIGILLLFIQFLVRYFSFIRLRRNAELLLDDSVKLYQVNKEIIPFSFGRSVFINRSLHSPGELQEIIRHEFVHVRQNHTIDILWAEFLCIFNWYNPFAWLIRRSVRQNLEFIADDKVLQNGIDRKQYQYLLVKVIGNNQFSIAPKFNFSSLKKRITMMNKMKSASLHVVKFLFILPMLIVLLLAFRNKGKEVLEPKKNVDQVQPSLLHQASYMLPRDTEPTVITSRTYDRDKIREISSSSEITENKAVIHLKNGKTEEYNLQNPSEKKTFFDKYGTIITVLQRSPRNPEEKVVEGVGIGSGEGKGISICKGNGKEEGDHYGEEDAVEPAKACSKTCVKTMTYVTANTVAGVKVNCNVTYVEPSIAISAVKPVFSVSEPKIATNVITAISPVKVTSPAIAKTVTGYSYNEKEPMIASTVADVGYAIMPENILFTISRTTTKGQLEEYKNQMKEKGFELNYTETKFDEKGRLTHISGTIKTENSSGTFSATDFSEVVVAQVMSNDRIHFKVEVMANKGRVI